MPFNQKVHRLFVAFFAAERPSPASSAAGVAVRGRVKRCMYTNYLDYHTPGPLYSLLSKFTAYMPIILAQCLEQGRHLLLHHEVGIHAIGYSALILPSRKSRM